MLRAPEEGSYNLTDYLREHGAELELEDLVHVRQTDEVVAPVVLTRLEQLRRAEHHALYRTETERVREVQRSARWQAEQVVLLPQALFRLISGMNGKKYIRFVGPKLDVAISRGPIARAGVALRAFNDVGALIDADGLHFSWRGGRGRLNFYPQPLRQPGDVLVVHLPSPTTRRSVSVLLGEVLAELGFGT
jgi:hypothetical protein